jgi:hypothetical protein
VEERERLYGVTRLRVSTDNVGLARLREGLELVRIESPQLSARRGAADAVRAAVPAVVRARVGR